MVAIVLTECSAVSAIVLAVGSGSKLGSHRPGRLEDLCGQPIFLSVLNAVVDAGVSSLSVVVSRGAEDVVKPLQGRLGDVGLGFVEQHVQRGTGDAVLAGLTVLDDHDYDDDGHVLIVHGDMPLLTGGLLRSFLRGHLESGAEASVLATPPFGPVANRPRLTQKASGSVAGIDVDGANQDTPSPDATADDPVVAGCYVVRRGLLAAAIRRTSPQNSRGDFNLNDAIGVLASAGHRVESHVVTDLDSVRSVSSYEDLAIAEALIRRRLTARWMARGVRMIDPARTYIDADVVLGAGVVLQPGTILRGFTVVGDHAELGPDTHLTDCAVGQHATVTRTTGRDAEVGPRAVVGPFAALEPGAQVAPDTVTGPNFVARYTD